jgi:HAD superfamily hydrolase (TIGR01509 family)
MRHAGSEAFPTASSSDSFDAVILDLGGVVLDLDPMGCLERFREYIPDLDPGTFAGRPEQLEFFSEFETGEIDPEELLRKFNQHYRSRLGMGLFSACWNSMVLDFPSGRIERLRSLGRQKRLFLLSNTNEIHEQAIHERFQRHSPDPFSRLFERMYFSHHLGMRKPDRAVFQHLIDQNGLDPDRTLFIDDSKQHIEGAGETGIRAVHLSEPHTLETLLESLGFRG